MDKETGEKQVKVEKDTDVFSEEEIKTLFAELDAHQKRTMNAIDKKLGSRWISRKDKAILQMIRGTIIMVDNLTKDSIMSLQFSAQINEAVQILADVLGNVTKKVDAEFPALKTEIDKLNNAVKDPMFSRVDSYIQTMKKILEQRAKAGEQYVE